MTKGKTQATGTGIGPGVGATKEQSIGGSGKELFVLKYLRFACCNLTRTKEFYISLGMSVEWQVKSNKQSADKDKKEGAAGAPDTPGDALGQDGKGLTAVSENPSESDATKSAKDGASNPAAAAVDDNANSIQSKTDLCLSFVNIPSTEHEVHAESHQFQLIFETGQVLDSLLVLFVVFLNCYHVTERNRGRRARRGSRTKQAKYISQTCSQKGGGGGRKERPQPRISGRLRAFPSQNRETPRI
ncbi:hypothetical protein BC830DRAFT_1117744 [Chytriomyces sp. MP71]|nr:hypothetical protein BC830DRAFT_1117744 [Chytriomyces sp. MP71]